MVGCLWQVLFSKDGHNHIFHETGFSAMQFWQSSQWEMESRAPLLEFRWTYDLLVANALWQSEVLLRPGQKRQCHLAHRKTSAWRLEPLSKKSNSSKVFLQSMGPPSLGATQVSGKPSYISCPKAMSPCLYIFPSSQLRPLISQRRDQLLISWLRESMSTVKLLYHTTTCGVVC